MEATLSRMKGGTAAAVVLAALFCVPGAASAAPKVTEEQALQKTREMIARADDAAKDAGQAYDKCGKLVDEVKERSEKLGQIKDSYGNLLDRVERVQKQAVREEIEQSEKEAQIEKFWREFDNLNLTYNGQLDRDADTIQ